MTTEEAGRRPWREQQVAASSEREGDVAGKRLREIRCLTGGPFSGKRGVCEGYVYHADKCTNNARVHWCCVDPKHKDCKGRLTTINNKVIKGRPHNHEANVNDVDPTCWDVISSLQVDDLPVNNTDRQQAIKMKEEIGEDLSAAPTSFSALSSLNTVKSAALSLTNAVRLVPSAYRPEVVDIIQQTLDDVANVVTRGIVSHVDVVPVIQEKDKHHSKTLREVVVDDALGRQTALSSKLKPCSVVVHRLTERPIRFGTAEVASSWKEDVWLRGSGTPTGLSVKEEDDFTVQTDDDAEDEDDEGNSHGHDDNLSDTTELNDSLIEERKHSVDYSVSDIGWDLRNSRHSKSIPTKKQDSKRSSKRTLNTSNHSDVYPCDPTQPLVGHSNSNYNIEKLMIKSYNSYDLDASFSTGINSTCPLCSKDSAYRSSSLRDLLTHLKNANHLTIEGKTSYNLGCPYCEKQETATFEDSTKEESLLLELLGELVHHLVEQHSYSPSSDFLPTLECKHCGIMFFSKARLQNHVVLQHMYDSPKPGTYSRGKNQSVEPSKRHGRPSNSPALKQTQKVSKNIIEEYKCDDLGEPFKPNTDTKCIFCPTSDFRAKHLNDFIEHLTEAGHLYANKNQYRTLLCPVCMEHIRGRIKSTGGSGGHQVLQLVCKVIHHMILHHGYEPDQNFVRPYSCTKCAKQWYSDREFRDHMRKVHIYLSKSPPGPPKVNKIGLIEKYENYSLRKAFEPSTESICPFCPLASEYKATSLADFVEHMVKSKHFEVKRHYVLKCPYCKEPHRNKIKPEEGCMRRQMLRLVGKVIQHMVRAHAFVPDPTFLPPYSCELCDEEFYADQEFLHHLTSDHQKRFASKRAAKESAKSLLPAKMSKKRGWRINSKSNSNAVSNPPNKKETVHESDQDAMPEAELDIDEEIPGGGVYCMFCDSKNNASLKTLDDFITHMETASHVVETEESGLAVICPKCPHRFKVCEPNELTDDHGSFLLPAINDTIQHLHTNHGYDLDQSFLHKFKFKHCNFKVIKSSQPMCSRKIECLTCNAMISAGYMKDHVKICSKPKDQFKRSPCPLCGKMLLNDDVPNHKVNFRKHIETCQTNVFSHLCSVCSMQFKFRNDLNRHMFKKHDMNISRTTPKYCDKCDYKTLSEFNFVRHLATHATETDFTCEKCGKQFKTNQRLHVHLTTVHKAKESKSTLFHCNQCSYTTPVRSYLSKHLRHHRDVNTGSGYWCNICKYNARYPAMLKKHMQKVHNIDIDNPSPNEVHSFTSSRGMRKYKNIRLPEEESTESNKVHDGPLKQRDVHTKEKIQASSTKTTSSLEEHRQGRLVSVGTKGGNSQIDDEMKTNRDPARLNNTEPRLDHSVVGLPAIGLGQVFDAGLGGMMNNGGHFGDQNRPTQTPAGDVDLSYSLPPANSLAYNLPNMFFQ